MISNVNVDYYRFLHVVTLQSPHPTKGLRLVGRTINTYKYCIQLNNSAEVQGSLKRHPLVEVAYIHFSFSLISLYLCRR